MKSKVNDQVPPISDELLQEKFKILRERWNQSSEPNNVLLMDYRKKYLSSTLWRKIRNRVLKRDNQICVYCGSEAQVVHHRSYEREVLEGKADHMLVSLCEDCHEYIHFNTCGRGRSMENPDAIYLDLKYSGCQRSMEDSDRILLEKNLPPYIIESSIRKRVLKRDNQICVYCGSEAQIVHHRSYVRILDENGQRSGGKTATIPMGKRPVQIESVVAG